MPNVDFSQSSNGAPDPTVASFLQANPYFQPNPTLATQGIIAPTSISPVALNYFKQNLIPTSATGYVFPEATAQAVSVVPAISVVATHMTMSWRAAGRTLSRRGRFW